MPYIKNEEKKLLAAGVPPSNAGELNYVITKLVNDYLLRKRKINYAAMNEIVGAMYSALTEFQRRIVAPYEDTKIEENGDVYDPKLLAENPWKMYSIGARTFQDRLELKEDN